MDLRTHELDQEELRMRLMPVTAPPKKINQAQYDALLNLFNECNEDFWTLGIATRTAFFDRLYNRD